MVGFLPPSGDQLKDLTSLIALIKAASDKDVQAVILQMKEQTDAAMKAQQESAKARSEAALDLDKAKALLADYDTKASAIAKRQNEQDITSVSLDVGAKKVQGDRKQLDAEKIKFQADMDVRLRDVTARETSVKEQEIVLFAAQKKAEDIQAEYQGKLAEIRQLAGK